MNSSKEAGFIPIINVLTEEVLEDCLTETVSALTGIERNLVIPRYQENMPKIPAKNKNWCAVGISQLLSKDYSYFEQVDMNEGHTHISSQYEALFTLSFYGSNAHVNALKLKEGLSIEQNRAILQSKGLCFQYAGTLVHVPELLQESWRKRVDISLTFTYQTSLQTEICNLVKSTGTFEVDTKNSKKELIVAFGCHGS